MADPIKANTIEVQAFDNQTIANYQSKDTLVVSDSVKNAKCSPSVYYREPYIYPEYKIEGLKEVPTTAPMQYVETPPKGRDCYGFINTVGFNFSLQLLLLIYFIYALRGKFERTIQAIGSSSKLERYYNEKELRNPLFFWLVYVSISLSSTFPILYTVARHEHGSVYLNYVPQSAWMLGWYLVLIHIAYFALTYLFFVFTNHYKHFGFWFLSRGIVMWPVSLVFTLLFGLLHAFGWDSGNLLGIFFIVYFVAYLKFLNHTYYMVKERGFSISVWILYLCALEIFPIVAILGVLWDVVTM